MKTSYTINGFVIPVVQVEACGRVSQFMKGLDITCGCSRCLVDNAGMTSAQVRTRMAEKYP